MKKLLLTLALIPALRVTDEKRSMRASEYLAEKMRTGSSWLHGAVTSGWIRVILPPGWPMS